jgi:hypothetical protein
MARKMIPAHPSRERSRDDESLLLRSAESLGRMIGSLQRQLEVATGRVAGSKPNGAAGGSSAAKSSVKAKSGTDARGGEQKQTRARKTGARKAAKKR